MKKWNQPTDEHIIYEALSAIADKRFEIVGSGLARSTSTSGNKTYTIHYNLDTHEFMSDDNMAFYRGEVSYPMVAVLLETNIIPYNNEALSYLKNIPWKDINQKNKNDYMKSVAEVLKNIHESGGDPELVVTAVNQIWEALKNKTLYLLGEKVVPSKAY